MDFLRVGNYKIVFLNDSPFLILIIAMLIIFLSMTLTMYFTNRKFSIQEMVSYVYVTHYEVPRFRKCGIIHCVTQHGQKIRLLDPEFAFQSYVSKLTPRECTTIRFRIEFKWRFILLVDIVVSGMQTPSLGLKRVRHGV